MTSERLPTIKEILHTADGIRDKAMEPEPRMILESEALAMVAAENEACQQLAAKVVSEECNKRCHVGISGAIAQRLTAPQIAALERVKAEARAIGKVEGKLESAYDVSRANVAEAEAKRLREALEKFGTHAENCDSVIRDEECDCGFNEAFSAPAVPGAAKGGGE